MAAIERAKTQGTKPDRVELLRLLDDVERVVQMKPVSPLDFEALSKRIFNLSKSLLSPSTLKRLWGYRHENVSPRMSTLSILSRCAGYLDWEDWRNGQQHQHPVASDQLLTPHIDVEASLEPGDLITLTWMPGRECVVEYLGSTLFEVRHSVATRLIAGVRFKCNIIIEGEPLYLTDIHLCGKGPIDGLREGCVYVCGSSRGISFKLNN